MVQGRAQGTGAGGCEWTDGVVRGPLAQVKLLF